MITAIARMGGVSAEQVRREAGTTLLDDRHQLKSGIKHSVTKNGLPLDTMREAMVEHGYLPEGATTRELIDAMVDAAQGKPTYSNQRVVDHDAELAAYEAQQLQDMIDMGDIPFSLQALDDGSQYTEDHLKVIGQAFMGPDTKYTDWLKQMKQTLGERFTALKNWMIKTYQELKRLYKEKAPAFMRDQKGSVQLSLFGLPDVARKEAFELRGQKWTQGDKKPVQQGLFDKPKELQQGGVQAGGQSVSAESAAPRKEVVSNKATVPVLNEENKQKPVEPVRVVEDYAPKTDAAPQSPKEIIKNFVESVIDGKEHPNKIAFQISTAAKQEKVKAETGIDIGATAEIVIDDAVVHVKNLSLIHI